MSFGDGAMYTVSQLTRSDPDWGGVEDAVQRKLRTTGLITLEEVWSVRWREKPFPWSYRTEFRPKRRFFFHGTSEDVIRKILDEGFKVGSPSCMLGPGVYVTYHTSKGRTYGADGYVISAMVYAPSLLCIEPGQALDSVAITAAPGRYDGIEVRTGATVNGWTMRNHELCVFDPRRVIPRFILKLS